MIPLSEFMFQRVIDHGEAEKTMEIKIYETVVQQIWSILPGYCDLPLDLTEAFDQGFAEILANLLYKQVELRLDVCRALKTLIESNQAIADIEEEEENLVLQSRISRADAKKNLEYLSQFAGNMLAVLFNVYTQTLPQSRGPILQTINTFLSITPNAELMEAEPLFWLLRCQRSSGDACKPKVIVTQFKYNILAGTEFNLRQDIRLSLLAS
jgi:ribosomal RNA-processing protein 12